MSDQNFVQKAQILIEKVVNSKTADFFELAKILDLNIYQDLAGADLSGINLSDKNLANADLSHANLKNTNLSNANLSSADLSDANLSGTDLSNANLSDANLSGTDLSNANLTNTNFSGAKLTSTTIIDLRKADLIAIEKGREVVDIALSFPGFYGKEAPINHLGEILSALQNLIIGIGQSVSNKLGGIPSDIATQMELVAYGSFESSYGIHLAAAVSPDLLGNSLISDALEELMELIESGDNDAELTSKLESLTHNSALRYRNFLKSLVDARAKVTLKRGSPKPRKNRITSVELPFDKAEHAFKLVNTIKTETRKEIEVVGRLTAINIDTKYFGIKSLTSNESYSGYIFQEAMLTAGTATIGKVYRARILEVSRASVAIGKFELKHKLLELTVSEDAEINSEIEAQKERAEV